MNSLKLDSLNRPKMWNLGNKNMYIFGFYFDILPPAPPKKTVVRRAEQFKVGTVWIGQKFRTWATKTFSFLAFKILKEKKTQ